MYRDLLGKLFQLLSGNFALAYVSNFQGIDPLHSAIPE